MYLAGLDGAQLPTGTGALATHILPGCRVCRNEPRQAATAHIRSSSCLCHPSNPKAIIYARGFALLNLAFKFSAFHKSCLCPRYPFPLSFTYISKSLCAALYLRESHAIDSYNLLQTTMDLQSLSTLFATTYSSDPNVQKSGELQIRKVCSSSSPHAQGRL